MLTSTSDNGRCGNDDGDDNAAGDNDGYDGGCLTTPSRSKRPGGDIAAMRRVASEQRIRIISRNPHSCAVTAL